MYKVYMHALHADATLCCNGAGMAMGFAIRGAAGSKFMRVKAGPCSSVHVEMGPCLIRGSHERNPKRTLSQNALARHQVGRSCQAPLPHSVSRASVPRYGGMCSPHHVGAERGPPGWVGVTRRHLGASLGLMSSSGEEMALFCHFPFSRVSQSIAAVQNEGGQSLSSL